MASASPYESDTAGTSRQHVGLTLFRTHCLPAVRFAGFWTAVLLPFVLLTLLATGLVVEQPLLTSGLLAVNLAGLLLGRNHNRQAA